MYENIVQKDMNKFIAATFCPKFEMYQGNEINVTGKYWGLYKDLFLTFHSEFCKKHILC